MNNNQSVEKQQKSKVFRAITELKNNLKVQGGAITLKELRKKLDKK